MSLKRMLLLSCFCALRIGQAQVAVVDDSGATVRLLRPAQRIVALTPHAAEMIFAAGAGDRLVGTVDFSDHPAAARRIPRVGSHARIDLEAIVALRPDLILAWQSGNLPAHVERLRALGYPVYVSQPERLEDVANELERLGILAGRERAGQAAARAYRERLDQLRSRYGQRPRVRTFYQIWKQPLSTVGGRQLISRVIRLCGGENIFESLQTLAPVVTEEAVIASQPEAIVASGMDRARPEWLDDWRQWPQMTAVQRNNLFFVPPELIQRHTPRLLDGAERLCQHLETARQRRTHDGLMMP